MDASIFADGNQAAVGGCIRNHYGVWATSFAGKNGSCSVLNPELHAIREVLELTRMHIFLNIVVESDSLTAVKLIEEDVWDDHPRNAHSKDCQILVHNPWNCSIRFTKGEANECAYKPAKRGHHLPSFRSNIKDAAE